MNLIDLDELKTIREGNKASEERYSRDRHMYLMGKQGLDKDFLERLSERDEACYDMGYSARNLS